MAYTVRDLSNAQRFEYKGYEVFMYCVEDSFWSGERTYKVDISISNHVYYRIAEDIQIARYQQQRQSYFPTAYNSGYNGTYDIMKKLKERILFSSSFNVIVKRKFTILKDNEPLSVSSTTQTIAVPAHEFRLFTNFKPTLTGIETTAPDAEKPLIYYNRGMDTLVLPAGEAKRVEVYSVNGMLVMTQEKCTSVGLSALPVGYYMARAYMEDGRVQVCKIMK